MRPTFPYTVCIYVFIYSQKRDKYLFFVRMETEAFVCHLLDKYEKRR